MRTIIGLIGHTADIHPTIQHLVKAGIAKERINLFTNSASINQLLGCDPRCTLYRCTAWGVGAGVSVYAIFGIAAALCQCNILHYDRPFGIGTFIGALLAGAFVGGIIGMMYGAGEADKDSHLYVQGARLGGKVISIQVSEEDVERVKRILVLENTLGVKALSSTTT